MLTGFVALASVGGLVLALVLNAGAFALRRGLLLRETRRQREKYHGDYSTPEAAALDKSLTETERYAHAVEFQIGMLLLSAVLTTVLYAGLWYEWVRGAFGAEPPTVETGIYFFFALIDGSMLLGANLSGWTRGS